METLTLTAPDISCDHCKHAIEGALGAGEGVQAVSVAVEPKQVTVTFDPKTIDRARIERTLEEEGYPVTAG